MAESSSNTLLHPLVRPDELTGNARNLAWLMRFRWIAIVSVALISSSLLPILRAPVESALGVMSMLGVLTVSTLLMTRRLEDPRPVRGVRVFNQLGLDLIVLTGCLAVTGGMQNPFAPLLLVHVAMIAMMTRGEYRSWLLALVAVCFGFLHIAYLPLDLFNAPVGSVIAVTDEFLGYAAAAGGIVGVVTAMRPYSRWSDDQ